MMKRQTYEIECRRIKLILSYPKKIQCIAPMDHIIQPELHKLCIMKKSHVTEKVDFPRGDNHIGTLVVCFPASKLRRNSLL